MLTDLLQAPVDVVHVATLDLHTGHFPFNSTSHPSWIINIQHMVTEPNLA